MPLVKFCHCRSLQSLYFFRSGLKMGQDGAIGRADLALMRMTVGLVDYEPREPVDVGDLATGCARNVVMFCRACWVRPTKLPLTNSLLAS